MCQNTALCGKYNVILNVRQVIAFSKFIRTNRLAGLAFSSIFVYFFKSFLLVSGKNVQKI